MLRSISGIARSSAAPTLIRPSAPADPPTSESPTTRSAISRRSVRLGRDLNATLDLLRIDDLKLPEKLPIRRRTALLAALARTLTVLDGIQVRSVDTVRRVLRRVEHERADHALRRRICPQQSHHPLRQQTPPDR